MRMVDGCTGLKEACVLALTDGGGSACRGAGWPRRKQGVYTVLGKRAACMMVTIWGSGLMKAGS